MAFPLNISIIGTDVEYTSSAHPTVSALSVLTGYVKFDAVAYFIKQLPTIEIDERLGVNKKSTYRTYELELRPLTYPKTATDPNTYFGTNVLLKDYLFLQFDGYSFILLDGATVSSGLTTKINLDSYEVNNSDGVYSISLKFSQRL